MWLWSAIVAYGAIALVLWTSWITAGVVALALATGALLATALIDILSLGSGSIAKLCFVALAGGLALKLAYWRAIDRSVPRYTAEAATGLGHLGKVRPLDPPHTQPNFVMREMGYQIARTHAERLRGFVIFALFGMPLALILIAGAAPWPIPALAHILAVAIAAPGVFVERWLFFAEAEHVSMLYYGRDTA